MNTKGLSGVPLTLRVFQRDLDRLDRLANILPMPKSAIAREALNRGLDLLEEAAPEFVRRRTLTDADVTLHNVECDLEEAKAEAVEMVKDAQSEGHMLLNKGEDRKHVNALIAKARKEAEKHVEKAQAAMYRAKKEWEREHDRESEKK